ncbi:hypothetical protein NLC26_01560 [Candidatus Aminicenantes bacterium AC-708-M15]|jgi:hypothetical protein|nr:hypothetical protein [SCandidatus Aminicenantes bacterium Aminicenantia_JdfR_composite]MCP2597196.1 hypothetical protein [Candidatus Aminicenantes bacterium AC-335-G13]MCP2598385.1 hypothetical protein [Candidatus Aminicenantes bacterium AC-335-L06]MCP2604148.1 hypothetical protein [Candidatus Aminicenantes bacterium AC-708-M15]MCP2617945.1 hypothetical protein [Candidatus Aminicenantes bacterium AC-335-A11]
MTKYKEKPISPKEIKTQSIHQRKSKVNIKSFATLVEKNCNFKTFIDSLPDILAGKDFKDLIQKIIIARKNQKALIWGIGAHVIKVGLSPVLIDLMEKGFVTALALNGAGIIHDFEIAFVGKTSEDVESQLKNGSFGMARETGEFLNKAINQGIKDEIGIGEAVGKFLCSSEYPHINKSLLATAYKLNIPVTVHVAIGTDIIHFHPQVCGEALGKASLKDFFLFASLLKKLEGGGFFLNIGSAVILPEIFLKALTMIRNLGFKVENFYTAVFDFNYQYRPLQNVMKRPVSEKGKGYYFIGHHEIMIPLLASALKTYS